MASGKVKAPQIQAVYSEFVTIPDPSSYTGEKTLKVYGHESRAKSLVQYWNRKYAIDESLPPITLVDVAPALTRAWNSYTKNEVKTSGFVVEITDIPHLATEPDVVINYQIGTVPQDYPELLKKDIVLLLGQSFFFCNDNDFVNDGFVCSDKPTVILIPNGNKKLFFDELNMQLTYQKVIETGAGGITIINHVDKETLLNYLDLSAIVVTTPSVTAMECLSMGFPVLLIKTADDQNGKFVENGLAHWYSPDVLSFLLNNKQARIAMGKNGKQIKNNIETVADLILRSYQGYINNEQS